MNSSYKKIIDSLDKKKLNAVVLALKKLKHGQIDELIHTFHDDLSESIDCLNCASCCKNLGPAVKDKDIQRISKYLKIKPSELTDKYLRIDEDGDYVFKQMPCPFLLNDNFCSVYESRPAACREYPHTDRKNFYQIIDLSFKNARICPIVAGVFKKVSANLK